MPEINFTPFGQDILEARPTEAVNRAIWCCIAPYILHPRDKIMIENVRSFYLAKLLLDLDGFPKKEQTRYRRIIEDTRKIHDLMGWIRVLVDAPPREDVRDIDWGGKRKLVRRDYLTVHRIISLYLRMESHRDKDAWLSMKSARKICQSDPMQDRHSGKNKIEDALRDYKKSSSLIFGMLQASANDGNRTTLLVPQRVHLEALCEKGHEYVREGLRYAAYAQRIPITAKPRNTNKPWLSRRDCWTLPDVTTLEQEEIRALLQPLTEQEKSCLAKGRARKKPVTPRLTPENSVPVLQEQ